MIHLKTPVSLSTILGPLHSTGYTSCYGAYKIRNYANAYIHNDLVCLSIYDSDTAGNDAKKINLEEGIQKDYEIISIAEVGAKKDKIEEMEDLIPDEVFKDSIKEFMKTESNDKNTKINDSPPRKEFVQEIILKKYNIKSSENLEKFKDIPEEEKNELKHELEDIIIDKLTEFLAQLDLTKEEDFQKVELLLKLNKMILERFIKIESENEEASSKEKNS